jgi:hypothetical protein
MNTIELLNAEGLTKVFAKAGESSVVSALKMAVNEEAQIMMRNSKRLVPVDTTALKQSGTIFPPIAQGTLITVEMGYGGSASAYAMRQHEDLSLKHKAGKQAKYLENPVRDRIKNFEAELIRRLTRILS